MNKVLTFLSNFGQMVLRGMNIVPAVTQVIESSAGQPIPVLDKLSQISALVKQIEVIGQNMKSPIPGPEKAQAIAPLVAQVILSSSLAAGKKMNPAKEAAFSAACTAMGGVVADIENCFEPDNTIVATTSIQAPQLPTAVLAPNPVKASNVTAFPLTPTPPAAPAPVPAAPAFPSVLAEIPDSPATAAAIAAGLQALPQD
jgi:hypothetical protein